MDLWQYEYVNRALKRGVWDMWQFRKNSLMAMNERWSSESESWRVHVPEWGK